MKRMLRLAGLLLGLGFLCTLAGCGGTAQHASMTSEPGTIAIAHRHAVSVRVVTLGGNETAGGGQSWIDDAELKQAVESSIRQSGLFSGVVDSGEDFLLTVTVINANRPVVGFSVTVGLELGWALERVKDHNVVWREALKTEHTAPMGAGFAFETRVRLALENAAKKNISQGLERISALNL